MDRRTVGVLGILALAALAGCSLVDFTGDRESTTPDSEETYEPTAPPGVSETGVNVSTILAAHDTALQATNYTFRHHQSMDNGSAVLDRRYGQVSESRFWSNESGFSERANASTFVNESAVYSLTKPPEQQFTVSEWSRKYETQPTVADASSRPNTTAMLAPGLETVSAASGLARLDYSIAGTIDHDGTAVTVLRANGTHDRPSLAAQSGIRDFAAYLLVDEFGIVRQSNVTIAIEDNGVSRYSAETAVTDVGSTHVEAPSWVGEAPAARNGHATVRKRFEAPDLGATLDVTAEAGALRNARLERAGHAKFADNEGYPVYESRVSEPIEFVRLEPSGRIYDATLTLSYNATRFPDTIVYPAKLSLYVWEHAATSYVDVREDISGATNDVRAEVGDHVDGSRTYFVVVLEDFYRNARGR